jgi:large subunit ribosomal protein L6
MSRIGKKPIVVPQGVTVTVSAANEITVKGPKGELKQAIDRDITVEVTAEGVQITRPTDQIRHRSLHGLYRSLIANMVQGVAEGFKRELELVGVGYRATVTGQQIDMALGFSHNIIFELPKEIKATATA